MTMTKQALLIDLDYSAWANQRLLDVCSALTAEEMDRDLGASHGGVIRTLRHMRLPHAPPLAYGSPAKLQFTNPTGGLVSQVSPSLRDYALLPFR